MIRLYLGRKERGKTTLGYYMVAKLPRRVIFDARGRIRRPGAVIARSVESFRLAMDALGDGQVSEVVYAPTDHLATVAFPTFAAEVKRWIDEQPAAPLGVLVDEITFVPILDPDFEWAFKCCNANHVHFFLTCHRPVDVPTDLRANADYWYVFQTQQEHDVKAIAERCSAKASELVGRLHGSEYLCWDGRMRTDNEDDRMSIHTDPSLWYVDLAPGPPLPPPIDLDKVIG